MVPDEIDWLILCFASRKWDLGKASLWKLEFSQSINTKILKKFSKNYFLEKNHQRFWKVPLVFTLSSGPKRKKKIPKKS